MINKERYIQFCNHTEIYVPIFSQPWWLEAVSDGHWDVLIAEENGRILAFNPYYYVEDAGRRIIRKAPLTQNNGVILNYPAGLKYEKKLSFEKKALNMIIDQLDAMHLDSYRQYFHYSFTNWLPYYWRGFQQTTRYTYVIDGQDMSDVMRNMNAKLRNQIKKAETLVSVHEGMSIADFYHFNQKTYERQNMEIPYSLDIVKRIEDACHIRGASRILYAVDGERNLHSAIYLIEDAQSVYYLMSGSDAQFRSSQALSLLIHRGIAYAMFTGKAFDFEGSMKQNIESHFSQFGAKQKAYMDIRKNYGTEK